MKDNQTAQAFATSWNNLPEGSIYTFDQFEDWFSPLTEKDIKNKKIIELGCGNASLLVHVAKWEPAVLHGVDLGDSILSANTNMLRTGFENFKIIQDDLTKFQSEDKYDLTYSIGVIHHLFTPKDGFDAVIANTKQGGKFHCWVYAREGNKVIITLVDPIRKVASKLPWWINKYAIATPLSAIYFLYAHAITKLKLTFMPLYSYSCWISKRNFLFFRHVAFDQLVTPQTKYIDRKTIEKWMSSCDLIDQTTTYIIFRNGNSWKFGGMLK